MNQIIFNGHKISMKETETLKRVKAKIASRRPIRKFGPHSLHPNFNGLNLNQAIESDTCDAADIEQNPTLGAWSLRLKP